MRIQLATQNGSPQATPDAQPPQRATALLHAAMGTIARLAGGVWTGARTPAARRMEVLETLALGARKQLVLIRCDGERFLVGTGADQVQSIVRIGRETSAHNDAIAESVL